MTYDSKQEEINRILATDNYYDILEINIDSTAQEVRKAYILKSRFCHPDKSIGYVNACEAFQKLSSAYETLSKPSSKKSYDYSGQKKYSYDSNQSFLDALTMIYNDFYIGDFENLLSVIDLINQRNPELNFDRDSANKILVELRDLVIVSGKYVDVAKFEIMRLYEIQNELCSLSYFNVLGRFKLTLKLSRTIISIPLVMHHMVKERSLMNKNLVNAINKVIHMMESVENSIDKVNLWLPNSNYIKPSLSAN